MLERNERGRLFDSYSLFSRGVLDLQEVRSMYAGPMMLSTSEGLKEKDG